MEPFDDYVRRLERLGIKKLGRGATATVFQHPKYKEIVVKVGLAKDDSQGYEWLLWCHRHTNLWTPKVYSVEELKTSLPPGKQGRMFVAFMERLDKADPKVVRKFFRTNKDVLPRLERSFWGLVPGAIQSVKDTGLRKALRAIDRFEHCDFKLENVMMRGTQIVFSDPVY